MPPNRDSIQAVAEDLRKRFPLDTLAVNGYWLPTIRAAIELNRGNPARAIDILDATKPFELYPLGGLYAVYLRGQAYLSQHQGREAATEFQKLLDHRGIVGSSTQGALTHLGLARAYAIEAQSVSGPDAFAAGVRGDASATTGNAASVIGVTYSPDGKGVVGLASASTGGGVGVAGSTNSPDGAGVNGFMGSSTGQGVGVVGTTLSTDGISHRVSYPGTSGQNELRIWTGLNLTNKGRRLRPVTLGTAQ